MRGMLQGNVWGHVELSGRPSWTQVRSSTVSGASPGQGGGMRRTLPGRGGDMRRTLPGGWWRYAAHARCRGGRGWVFRGAWFGAGLDSCAVLTETRNRVQRHTRRWAFRETPNNIQGNTCHSGVRGKIQGSGHTIDSAAEWSRAPAPGASPQGRGFEPPLSHFCSGGPGPMLKETPNHVQRNTRGLTFRETPNGFQGNTRGFSSGIRRSTPRLGGLPVCPGQVLVLRAATKRGFVLVYDIRLHTYYIMVYDIFIYYITL